jgi:hypothetical protein
MVNARSKPNARKPRFQRVWVPAILVFGLALTGAWMALLGYGLIWLVGSIF